MQKPIANSEESRVSSPFDKFAFGDLPSSQPFRQTSALPLILTLLTGTLASCGNVETPTGKPKLACDQAKFYPAWQLRAQASASRVSGDIESANRLVKLGLLSLGGDYDPYTESLDDTGLHESLAVLEENKGHIDRSAYIRLRVLESRLSIYEHTHKCRVQGPTRSLSNPRR